MVHAHGQMALKHNTEIEFSSFYKLFDKYINKHVRNLCNFLFTGFVSTGIH